MIKIISFLKYVFNLLLLDDGVYKKWTGYLRGWIWSAPRKCVYVCNNYFMLESHTVMITTTEPSRTIYNLSQKTHPNNLTNDQRDSLRSVSITVPRQPISHSNFSHRWI